MRAQAANAVKLADSGRTLGPDRYLLQQFLNVLPYLIRFRISLHQKGPAVPYVLY